MKTNPALWIFGDSWSALSTTDPASVWTRQLAHKLAISIGQEITLRNHSLIGSAQDWAVLEYYKVLDEIKPEDYVIFILTSPARYWYFEDIPSASNWNILDFDTVVGKDRANAVEQYIKYIQRPQMDELATHGRIAGIAYETYRRELRRPLLVKGFVQEFGPSSTYKHLNIAEGVLASIQHSEYQNTELVEKMAARGQPGYFKGSDCRYNHLCLSNHDILADKLLDGLINDTSPDLSSGFYTDLIAPDWQRDEEFCQNELNPLMVKYFIENLLGNSVITGWQRRTGVEAVMKGLKFHS